MNILDKIVADKKQELRAQKKDLELSEILDMPYYQRKGISVSSILASRKASVISEFKRRSPSRSDINQDAVVGDIIPAYEQGGASCISVLTDRTYFKGDAKDLMAARALTQIPLLRKDFIIDPYQIHEAKALGADLILLIAYCLGKEEAQELTELAHAVGLEVLYEIHDQKELEKMPNNVDILGVNNRNLTNFVVDYQYALDIYADLPTTPVKISESGILSVDSFVQTMKKGYKACLIGEFLMKENDPTSTIQELIKKAQDEN